mmetsp:Transcript_5900/g.20772  ORF Transcript_5900/g.20772 Transcript_5900/m.20772 type:complete len:83 (-) Transcript_5900:90-338(-)
MRKESRVERSSGSKLATGIQAKRNATDENHPMALRHARERSSKALQTTRAKVCASTTRAVEPIARFPDPTREPEHSQAFDRP